MARWNTANNNNNDAEEACSKPRVGARAKVEKHRRRASNSLLPPSTSSTADVHTGVRPPDPIIIHHRIVDAYEATTTRTECLRQDSFHLPQGGEREGGEEEGWGG